jgi:hypothetical protein
MSALPVPEQPVNPGYDPTCEECVEIGPAACWDHFTQTRPLGRPRKPSRACRADCSMHALGEHDRPTPEEVAMAKHWGSRTCPMP